MLSSFNRLTRFTVEPRLITAKRLLVSLPTFNKERQGPLQPTGLLVRFHETFHFSVPDLDLIDAIRPQLDRVGESHAPPSKTFRTGVY